MNLEELRQHAIEHQVCIVTAQQKKRPAPPVGDEEIKQAFEEVRRMTFVPPK